MKDPDNKPGRGADEIAHSDEAHNHDGAGDAHGSFDFFDIEGSDPETLHSGRIPDPQPLHTPLFRAIAKMLGTIEERLRARGGVSLRMAIRVFWGFVTAAGILLLLGPVINKPLDFDDIIASADVDEVDWVARDAIIDYSVERTDVDTFATSVSEAYTADFRNGPEPGIERTIVTEFQGHDVQFELNSATIDGEKATVKVSRKATTTVIRLTQPNGEKFEGKHEIAVDYELHDLITTETDEATQRTVDKWDWPLFAPTWPQATKGIDVSLSISREVNDALVRAPRAYVGWLLVSGTERLTPDEETADWVRYSFSNDDSLPPNADIWIHATFEPGTFEQPPKTPLFWVQTYGPLVPLVLLIALLLFALSARRIVWADTAGEPWYVARSAPPDHLSYSIAAGLLDKPWHAELLETLATSTKPKARKKRLRIIRAGSRLDARAMPGSATLKRREQWLSAVARAGRRAGLFGNVLSAMHWASSWSTNDQIVKQKLRWVPDSYVRDTLIFAPLAITLVQWGMLRQLSHQVILSVVWWPAAFVIASTVLALASVIAVWRPRPLTRAGALAVQQLKGINVFADATRLIDRGPIDDPLLGYAMLFESPRRAGNVAAELAVIETGDRNVAKGWRTERYVSIPALLALAAGVSVLVASIVGVSTIRAPYAHDPDKITEYGDLPGTIYTQVQGFEIDAKISKGDDGGARVDVTERLSVEFDDSGSRVPQYAQEWPTERLGQDLGFELESVSIDGEEVPYREIKNPDSESVAMLTQLEDVLTDVHEIETSYSVTSPVVDAATGDVEVQQLRWVALYDFWEHEYYTNISNPFDGSAPVRPIRLQVTITPEIASEVLHGGWIDSDFDQESVPHEDGNSFSPWSSEQQYVSESDDELHELNVGSESTAADGSLVALLDFEDMGAQPGDAIDKYDSGLTSDLGVSLDFKPGTFPGIDDQAYEVHAFAYGLPFALLLWGSGAVIAASLGMFVFALRMKRRASASVATIAYLAIPAAAVAQAVLFFWAIGPMAGDDSRIPGVMVLSGVMWVAAIGQAIVVARKLRKVAQLAAHELRSKQE